MIEDRIELKRLFIFSVCDLWINDKNELPPPKWLRSHHWDEVIFWKF